MSNSDVQLFAWYALCSAVCIVLVGAAIHQARTRGLRRAGLRIAVALAIAAWAFPISQVMLNARAQRALAEEMIAYKGHPLSVLESKFGPGRGCSEVARTFAVAPWYAPFGLWDVQVYAGEESGVMAAYFDD